MRQNAQKISISSKKFDQSFEYVSIVYLHALYESKNESTISQKTYLKSSASSSDRQLLYTLHFFGLNIA